ncbi:MAG: hypothetical protein FJY65_04200 [Calditrichaeota bacterium]|nr:hypothetical protein [Calditrichota bacterium]
MNRILNRVLISLIACAAIILVFVGAGAPEAAPEGAKPGFFRYPTISGDWIVFTSEGDLWKAPLAGGVAMRLTTHEGEERYAKFSPDGKYIAFTGQDDGQDDVYIIPSSGGEPRRLTFHPDRDQTIGWTPDGSILFRSTRDIPYRGWRIYKVSPKGSLPVSIGLDKAALIAFEPNGKRIAFNPTTLENHRWKRYQGGWAMDIWVGDMSVPQFENITEKPPYKDWQGDYGFPMWHSNGRVYFLSNMDSRANIHSMKPDGSDHKQHTQHKEFDARFPSLGSDKIVYQAGMDIWAFDIKSEKTAKVEIQLPSDRVQARVKYIDPKQFISDFELSPDGKRVLLNARGEVATAPSKGEGLIRQITNSPGSKEKNPRWSPDGKSIAVWSDVSGEEQLFTYPSTGGEAKFIGTDGRGWHTAPVWSPDGKSLAFGNEECELLVMDAASGKTEKVERSEWEVRQMVWSPDSRYLAYASAVKNYNSVIRIWDAQTKKVYNLTDEFYNSASPSWAPDGKYLYILSDRDANPRLDGMEMTYILDKRTRLYVFSLKKDCLSPFAPQIDPEVEEEPPWMKNKDKADKGKDEKKDDKGKKKDKDEKTEEKKEPVKVEVDFDGLPMRMAVAPAPAGNYGGLWAVEGKLFFLSWENDGMLGDDLFEEEKGRLNLHRFDIKKKKDKVAAEGIDGYDISRDGKKLLIYKRGEFTVMGIDEDGGGWGGKWGGGDKPEEESKNVELSKWEMRVDVRPEWRQMFDEAWRLQRDFFWDPNMHGVDWKAVRAKYEPLAQRISTRDELNDLIGELFAELNCSHTYVWGGDQRRPKYYNTGLLGVDYVRDNSGFIRITRVIAGRPWEPKSSSPLAAPGIDAKAGDYIVAINGRPTNSVPNWFELLLGRADKITTVSLNAKPALDGAREVVVKPLGTEYYLRYNDWVDGRKAYVDKISGGKLGYIHLTDMGGSGLSEFTAGYQPQHNKEGLIMDVRYNGGGFVAEMILSHLARDLWSMGMARHGLKYRRPSTAFFGFMAAVCNGETGSDGETFTEGFKSLGLGPVIGTRTWGGWVGIRGDKPFIDRGMTTQPEFTGWGMKDGKWLIEGWGTDPDIVVVDDPASLMQGKDPSLDYTINYLMDKITKEPRKIPDQPPFPKDRGYRK